VKPVTSSLPTSGAITDRGARFFGTAVGATGGFPARVFSPRPARAGKPPVAHGTRFAAESRAERSHFVVQYGAEWCIDAGKTLPILPRWVAGVMSPAPNEATWKRGWGRRRVANENVCRNSEVMAGQIVGPFLERYGPVRRGTSGYEVRKTRVFEVVLRRLYAMRAQKRVRGIGGDMGKGGSSHAVSERHRRADTWGRSIQMRKHPGRHWCSARGVASGMVRALWVGGSSSRRSRHQAFTFQCSNVCKHP
jgi:hypothetical protein